MAPLRPRPAALAMAHFNIEPAHNRLPHDVFLVLRRDPFHLHRAPAPAKPRQRRHQHFIHSLRHGPEGGLPIVIASFAARQFGFRLRFPFGKGSGLTRDGATGFFQILLQPLDTLLEPFVLKARLFHLPL